MNVFSWALSGLLCIGGTASLAHAQSLVPEVSSTSTVRPTPDGFSELSKTLMPSVVNISTSQRVIEAGMPEFPEGSPMERFNDLFGRDDDGFRRTSSLGSGFVISASGYIVTNNHVIEDADEIEVTFPDGTTLPAELTGKDAETDIAVLKIEAPTALPFVRFADSDAAEVGDWVIAIGNPFGLGGSVSAGIISARNRDINAGSYDDFIQTDAAINRGNSGGPLFNLAGDVVGVNTAIISPTGGSVGIGFSVPSNLAERIVEELIETGTIERGWLGVNIQAVDSALAKAYGLSTSDGVIVTQVTEDSPGDAAGIEIGDLILRFNDEVVSDTRELSRLVADTEIGVDVPVLIIREGERETLSVTLETRDSGRDEDEEGTEGDSPLFLGANAFGLKLAEITEEARRRWRIPQPTEGALIEMIDPDGAAYGFLQKGDVITEVNFKAVISPSEADAALEGAAGADPVLVKVLRRGNVTFVALQIEA